ncbi:MAG: ACP S-malonyltransferase [Myxococcales bacterium]|nr:ACP S-malonyltransferase [Myxococcales bacterium]
MTTTTSQPYALLFPGQGSQKVGMGKALFDASPAARAVFEEADDVLGERLSALCFDGDEGELALTANTQPAILTCSVAALRVFRERLEPQLGAPAVCAGHSLGEFSALVAAGALRFADALRLVRIRGQAMQEAVPAGVGAMAAIIGMPADELEALCVRISSEGDGEVSPANENGGGQIVVAGHAGAVERLVAEIEATERVRAIPLQVSAPFHCGLMAPAAERLAAALEDIAIGRLAIPVIANVDAAPYPDAAQVKDRLVRQVTSRVRWEASVQRLAHDGVSRGFELGHGRVLAGLCRRIDRALKITGLGAPADFDRVAA